MVCQASTKEESGTWKMLSRRRHTHVHFLLILSCLSNILYIFIQLSFSLFFLFVPHSLREHHQLALPVEAMATPLLPMLSTATPSNTEVDPLDRIPPIAATIQTTEHTIITQPRVVEVPPPPYREVNTQAREVATITPQVMPMSVPHPLKKTLHSPPP